MKIKFKDEKKRELCLENYEKNSVLIHLQKTRALFCVYEVCNKLVLNFPRFSFF